MEKEIKFGDFADKITQYRNVLLCFAIDQPLRNELVRDFAWLLWIEYFDAPKQARLEAEMRRARRRPLARVGG